MAAMIPHLGCLDRAAEDGSWCIQASGCCVLVPRTMHWCRFFQRRSLRSV